MTTLGEIGGYSLVRRLGRGGMGEVYEAVAPDGRRCALKVFALAQTERRFLADRFRVEGRILSKIEHPRLVHVFELGSDPADARPFFAMELVLGASGEPQTLEDVRRAGKVSEASAERWYQDLRSALVYCHSQGIVHRDLKLENVLVDAEGHAVLTDFGVSRIFEPEVRSELGVTTTFVEGETTGTRPVMGTYWYLAPEVRRGAVATAASDWYALGVAFFRLLTGMWYEPGTDALELLSPFDPKWRRRLARLLDESPARRSPFEEARARRSVWRRAVVAAGLAAAAVLVAFALTMRRMTDGEGRLRVQGRQLVLEDALAGRLEFCACPAGELTSGAQQVAVTRDYYLQRTPFTRREWFLCRGEKLTAWAGGEDAPMTYVTRAEVMELCETLNRRFAGRLPAGMEIRLPTAAEWRLAYARGRAETNLLADAAHAEPAARCGRGWFGVGADRTVYSSGMAGYYRARQLAVPMVTNLWPEFPPRQLSGKVARWARYASQFAPVPVARKDPDALGLYDMLGNCLEMVVDRAEPDLGHWSASEFGVLAGELYAGKGMAVSDPVVKGGAKTLMLGNYRSPESPGDEVWVAPFDRLPHLGFRLCVGPRLEEEN